MKDGRLTPTQDEAGCGCLLLALSVAASWLIIALIVGVSNTITALLAAFTLLTAIGLLTGLRNR